MNHEQRPTSAPSWPTATKRRRMQPNGQLASLGVCAPETYVLGDSDPATTPIEFLAPELTTGIHPTPPIRGLPPAQSSIPSRTRCQPQRLRPRLAHLYPSQSQQRHILRRRQGDQVQPGLGCPNQHCLGHTLVLQGSRSSGYQRPPQRRRHQGLARQRHHVRRRR